jgi:hypothetical protein
MLSKELFEISVITNKSGLDADPLFYIRIRVASRSLTSVHFETLFYISPLTEYFQN